MTNQDNTTDVGAVPTSSTKTVIKADPHVELFAQRLPVRSLVLDYGSGRGRNSLFLASQGHRVVSVEHDKNYIREGHHMSRALGYTSLEHVSIQGDVRRPMFRSASFHAVVMNRVLQELATKQEAIDTLDHVRRLTRPGGLHMVAAYFASERQKREKPNLVLFDEGELKQNYITAGWSVLESSGESLLPLQRYRDRLEVQSCSVVVAQCPIPQTTYMDANRRIHYVETHVR